MCLALPGKVVKIYHTTEALLTSADVNFDGVTKQVNLAYLENVKVGDYVIIHAGVAIQTLDEKSALETIEYFRQIGTDSHSESKS
jgi:hydrogenase expression/formation protein HypC